MEQPQQQRHKQQQQGCKYYCKICKKGFACGRALGGHMRAHGINDDVASTDEDAEPPQTSYALRSNPNRLKTCRACENCGKDFSSWKSFLEHGRCGGTSGSGHDGEADGSTMLSLSKSDGAAVDTGGCTGWSKGKRSRRAVVADGPSSEEDDLAASCLVMLSAARVDPVAGTETEESCASASREEEEDSKKYLTEGITMNSAFAFEMPKPKELPSSSKGVFECKACKRVFTSHQALGGHRASHKKVKGCFAAKLDVDNDDHPLEEEPVTTSDTEKMALVPFDNAPMVVTPLRKKGKLHECTICHRVFTSGQALGGHKRCHWLTGNTASTSGIATIAKIHQTHDVVQHQQLLQLEPILEMKTGPSLDLNLPVSTVAMATTTAHDTLTLEMSAALCLQNYMNKKDYNNNNIINTNIDSIKSDNIKTKKNGGSSCCDLQDDEGERKKSKVARLSELKDVSMGGENSQWLQVGIGSCTDGSNAET